MTTVPYQDVGSAVSGELMFETNRYHGRDHRLQSLLDRLDHGSVFASQISGFSTLRSLSRHHSSALKCNRRVIHRNRYHVLAVLSVRFGRGHHIARYFQPD